VCVDNDLERSASLFRQAVCFDHAVEAFEAPPAEEVIHLEDKGKMRERAKRLKKI
jgi:hypothetical protein